MLPMSPKVICMYNMSKTKKTPILTISARFLPLVNNARSIKSTSVREGVARLRLFVMIMWRNDTMIKPKESSHFQFYRPGQVSFQGWINIILS